MCSRDKEASFGSMRDDMKKHKGLWWKIGLPVAAFLLLAAMASILLVWHNNVYTLSMKMEGETEITIEHGKAYTDPGVAAQVRGSVLQKEQKDVEVTAEGTVDTSQVGVYEITYRAEYTAEFLFFKETLTASAKRTVRVVDTRAPIIRLETDPGKHVLPGAEYVEEGYKATDACDGDLTSQVKSKIVGREVIYSVEDSSGNIGYAVRRIKYRDEVAPELKLEGQTYMFLKKGTQYKEPGFAAIDADEGDMTAGVAVTGKVDHDATGEYELTYTVSDSYGNTSTAKRRVRVSDADNIPELPIWDPQNPGKSNGRVIYLTFDDGPSQHTERLLDILDQYGVKATFFVVNTGNMEILSRMKASGHTVAMHSATHRYDRIYASDAAFYEDMQKIQNIIYSHTGDVSRILRFPGGTSNTVSKKDCPGIMTRLSQDLKAMGYRYFDWNVDSRDASDAKSWEDVYTNVINGCSQKDFSVVLQHDTMEFSVDAVELIILWGLGNGYTFMPLDVNSPACEHGVSN